MTKYIYIFFIGFIINSNIIFSQQANNLKIGSENKSYTFDNVPIDVTNKCNDFFKLFINSKIDDAFSSILQNSPIAKKEDQMKNLINGAKQAETFYGKMLDFEPARIDFVTNSLIRILYLSLHSDFPIRWYFTFYKSPVRGWIIINLKFDDDSQMLFIDE